MHTHICRGAERQGALSRAPSVPHPVTETRGWPKKGISTMSRSHLWALTAGGHTVQPSGCSTYYQLCDLDKLLSMAKPLFPHL